MKVGEYYGEKIETWNGAKWLQELENHHVLVMSAQILVDMIQHNYISELRPVARTCFKIYFFLYKCLLAGLEQINLIVFDEW